MKKFLFLGIGTALMFTMGGVGPAQADGGQHISTASDVNAAVVIANAGAGRCASCHRAHTAKAEYLLKQAQPALCYTCHGGGTGATTDVQFGVSGGTAALRGGGFEFAKIDSGSATKVMGPTAASYGIPSTLQVIPALGLAQPVKPTTSRHNINGGSGDAGIAWGNGAIDSGVGKANVTLECGSCHDPHGNGNYRILRPIPVDAATTAVAASAAGVTPVVAAVAAVVVAPIKIPDVPTDVAGQPSNHIYTTANYWLTGDAKSPLNATAYTANHGVGTGTATPDGYIQNIAAWCTTCHTRYLATTGSYKTASGDPTFMYKHRSDANSSQGAANCITCHVSHGSNAAMVGVSAGVPLPGVGAPAGDSRLLRVDNRGTCVMCHNV